MDKRLALLLAGLAACATQSPPRTTPGPDSLSSLESAFASVTPAELLAHVRVLASDEYEGRAIATQGERLTIDYLSAQFRSAGLRPAAPDQTFLQKVPLFGYTSIPEFSVASKLGERLLRFPEEYVARSRRLQPVVTVENSSFVFVGFGIEAPQFGWDDFKGVDLRGKTLIMLEGEPRNTSAAAEHGTAKRLFRETETYYATRSYKFEIGAQKGAAAVLLVHDEEVSATPFEELQKAYRRESFEIAPREETERPAVEGWITRAAFERLCSDAGEDPADLRQRASARQFQPRELAATAGFAVTTELRTLDSHNVVAILEGSDESLKHEYLIYSAHWDHLGRDAALAGDQIYNGAIDNAAGVAQLLEIAEGFASLDRAPRRSVLFIATTGEERGHLGARYYTQNPLYALANAAADINLDAGNVWGRTTDVNNMGYGLTSLDAELDKAAKRQNRTFVGEPFAEGTYFFLSDQAAFAKAGIPSVFPGPGSTYVGKPPDFGDEKWSDYGENRYHRVSDEVSPDWDLSGAAEDARWLLDVGYTVAQSDRMPTWNANAEFRRPDRADPQLGE
jgi:hypothetical protein